MGGRYAGKLIQTRASTDAWQRRQELSLYPATGATAAVGGVVDAEDWRGQGGRSQTMHPDKGSGAQVTAMALYSRFRGDMPKKRRSCRLF